MLTTVENLSGKSFTVAALREIAGRMGISLPSKATKPTIAQIIADGIDKDHAEALDMVREAEQIAEMLDEAFPDTMEGIDAAYRVKIRVERRINNYIRQRGTDKLTAPQWRRIRKSLRKANLNLRDLNLSFI